jgi:hypothetical protein
MKRLTLLLVSIAATSMALATTYVRVEKDGSKTYSDRPLPGGQPVELQPAQTYSAPKSSSDSGSSSDLSAEQRALQGIDDFNYTSCTISPENDASFTNPENVTVQVSTEPGLRAGDSVNLVVDGKAADPQATQFVLEPAERGTHTASATLRNAHGRVLCSASVSFHVIRPSLNLPGRR